MALQLTNLTDLAGVTHAAAYLRIQTLTFTRGIPGSGIINAECVVAVYKDQPAMVAGRGKIQLDLPRRLRLRKRPATAGTWECLVCNETGEATDLPDECPECAGSVQWNTEPVAAVNEMSTLLGALNGNGTKVVAAAEADLKAKYQLLADASDIAGD